MERGFWGFARAGARGGRGWRGRAGEGCFRGETAVERRCGYRMLLDRI